MRLKPRSACLPVASTAGRPSTCIFEMKTSSASADRTTNMNLYPGKEDTMTTKLLAWCQYPEPHGTAYSDQDFADQRKVVEVLDRAQVLRAYITAEGWQKLWRLYGLRGLLDLN